MKYTVYSVEKKKKVELQPFNEEELALYFAAQVMESFDECTLLITDHKDRPLHRVSKRGEQAQWKQYDYTKDDMFQYN